MNKPSIYLRPALLRLLLWLLLVLTVIFAALVRAHAGEDLSRSADHDYDPPVAGTYQLPIIKAAADGSLVDAAGKPISLRELTRGRVTILSFIYTRCASAKACPMATGVLMDIHELSADNSELAKNLRLVSMSFDPEHDTPERMRAYSALGSERPGAAPWHFVTSRSEAELRPLLAAYGQAVDRKVNPADPTGPLNHTLRVYLIDREGRIRNIYSSGTLDVRLVLADVRTLLLEKPRNSDS